MRDDLKGGATKLISCLDSARAMCALWTDARYRRNERQIRCLRKPNECAPTKLVYPTHVDETAEKLYPWWSSPTYRTK